jgi:hypothetical protein
MARRARSIGAGEFKAHCLALLDEVAHTGQSPVAEVVPCREAPSLRGSIVSEGDLISPVGEDWNADE